MNINGITTSFKLSNLKVTMGNDSITSITADVTDRPKNVSSVSLHNLNINDIQFNLIANSENAMGNIILSFPCNGSNLHFEYVREMTQDEIEKELGYKISII